MMSATKAQDYYSKMIEDARNYRTTSLIVPIRPFQSGARLYDKTSAWVAAITTAKEINTFVQYLTLGGKKVIFDNSIDFNEKKITKVTVSDTYTETVFQIEITNKENKSQIWIVDTRNAIKIPGEVVHQANRKF